MTPLELETYDTISAATGIPTGTLRVWLTRGKLPPPDYRVGPTPAWLAETILPWIEEHRPDHS